MAQHSDTPALAVEAHFGEARLGRAFQARDNGLKETLLAKEPVDGLIQGTAEANLKLLAGGGPLTGREKREALREFPVLLASLRERYQTILVELPAVDDPAFDKLQVSALADAVILVADSKTAQPIKLRRAAERLRKERTNLAATMLDSTQTLGAQPGSRVWNPRMTGRP
jgi:Mrp family chromosome partitioning ATPase